MFDRFSWERNKHLYNPIFFNFNVFVSDDLEIEKHNLKIVQLFLNVYSLLINLEFYVEDDHFLFVIPEFYSEIQYYLS